MTRRYRHYGHTHYQIKLFGDDLKTAQDIIRIARAPAHLNDHPNPQNLCGIVGVPGEVKSAAMAKSDV